MFIVLRLQRLARSLHLREVLRELLQLRIQLLDRALQSAAATGRRWALRRCDHRERPRAARNGTHARVDRRSSRKGDVLLDCRSRVENAFFDGVPICSLIVSRISSFRVSSRMSLICSLTVSRGMSLITSFRGP